MKLIPYVRSHLLWKMLCWFVLLLLIPCLVLVGAYIAVSNYYLAQETAELEQAALSQCCENIQRDMRTCAEVSQVIQRHSNFLRFLNGGYPTAALQLEAYLKEFYNMFSYAESFSPYIEHVQIYAMRSGLIDIDNSVVNIDQLGEYALDKPTSQGYWRFDPETGRFIYRKLLTTLYDSTPVGVMEVTCIAELVCDKLSGFSESVSRPVYITGSGGTFLLEDAALAAASLPEDREGGLSQSLSALNMTLEAGPRQPRGQRQPVNFLLLTFTVGLAVVMLGSFFFFLYIFRLSRRVVRFSKYISTSFTQIPGAYTDPGHDELSLVVQNFNQMLEENNDLINQIKLEKLRQNEMAYRVLQAQIDPHFIYNALESVRMMAEIHDEPEIADVIFSFSKMMRYSFSVNTGLVTVDYELDIVDQYLRVQKIRLGDQLRYEITCPEELGELRCPQFVLQPLVENAIKYGRSQQHPEIFVEVRLSLAEGRLTAAVENDGAEMEPERRGEINRRLKNGQDLSGISSGTGVGLDSINNRMRYLYPESFEMEVLPGARGGVKVALGWNPKEGAEEA